MRTKNASRELTVAQYRDEFLSGRSQSAREEFLSRPLDKQYASIIQWRRNKRLRESIPAATSEIIAALDNVRDLISNAAEISQADASAINERLDSLHVHLAEYLEKQKARTISELEAESARIADKLRTLRGY